VLSVSAAEYIGPGVSHVHIGQRGYPSRVRVRDHLPRRTQARDDFARVPLHPVPGALSPIPRDDWFADAEKLLVLALLTMPLVATVMLALIPIRLVGPRP
jgi:hypothetical protein